MKDYIVKEKSNKLHTIKRRKSKWIGHFLRRNCLLKHTVKGKIEEGIEEDVSSYCITLRKRQDTGN
jgi:hypothetical protein